MYWARGLIPRFRLSFLRRRVFGMHPVMFSSADKLGSNRHISDVLAPRLSSMAARSNIHWSAWALRPA